MTKKIVIGIGIVVLVAVVAVIAYILRPSAEASQPIEAIPIQEESVDDQTVEAEDMKEESAEAVEDTALEEEMVEESSAESEAEAAESTSSSDPVIFIIDQAASEARFSLDELLRGNPTTVVGITDQVAGEIGVDFSNPANSQIGVIQVNARTLVTDNNYRNRAMQNEILDTADFEFISFTPTAVEGVPVSINFGEEYTFSISGDLTIRDFTNATTFEAKVTAISESELRGYASTTVARADYDLQIPSVPSVADVDEQVLVEIEFTAFAQTE